MKKINLRELYPDVYPTDFFIDVTEEVMETIRAAERAEAAYERKMYRYKAQYSLDCENGIENAVLLKPQTPEMLLEEKQFQEQVYAAVMKLPEKQAKRIYARYYLGMTVNEIAEVEGVDPSRVRDSIRRGFHLMRLFFAFFVSVNKKDKFSSFISTYGTVMKRGVLYYRTRIKDANGKLVAIYAKTPEELYNKETLALEQINLYCSRQRTIMYSVEVQNGLYDTKRGRRKMGRDTS